MGRPKTKTQIINAAKNPKYQGRDFCSRQCFGRWMGKEHGFGTPNNPHTGGRIPTIACKRGHIRTEEDTYYFTNKQGYLCRQCKLCQKIYRETSEVRRKQEQAHGIIRVKSVRKKSRHKLVTHCSRGHLFDEKNTYISSNGTKQCRECGRISHRKNYKKALKKVK